ncbi:MAG: glycosyltransferase [Desulfobulbia bacterium]
MEPKSLTSLKNQISSFDPKEFRRGYHSVVKRINASNKKRVHFVCTNEWFFKSHFIPLSEAAKTLNNLETSLITKFDEVDGTQSVFAIQKHFVNFIRSRIFSKSTVRTVQFLYQIFRREHPDLIHLIGLRPIIFGGFAALFAKRSAVVYHLTGTGYLAVNKSLWSKILFAICLRAIVLFLKQRDSHLIVENEEDLETLRSKGNVSDANITILGGAGVDPEKYNAQPSPNNPQLKVAYVGRMIWSKGVDLLVETATKLECRNVDAQFDLYGQPDRGNLREIDENLLKHWSARSNFT